MQNYIIAGYGKFKYIKKISPRKAKQLKDKDKEVFESYEDAKEELEKKYENKKKIT